jgi:hypothetical protein
VSGAFELRFVRTLRGECQGKSAGHRLVADRLMAYLLHLENIGARFWGRLAARDKDAVLAWVYAVCS